MILDGLDEVDGRYDTVVRMIKNLADHPNIKICLSSRPLLIFEEAFNGASGLRLQDLTHHSIRAYADAQLSDLIQERVLRDKQDGHRAEAILNNIVERANGVFLWAVIAVRDIRDGLQGIADLDELAQTVDSLPPELESLFMLMLNRIKPVYQRDAARYLQIALHASDRASDWCRSLSPTLTLCSLHLIYIQRDFEDAPFVYEKVATSEIVLVCETLRTQLLSHTAGLLELTPDAQGHSRFDLRPNNQPLLNMDVNFLHRTVRDFLCCNDKARSFLARNGFTVPQVHLAIARGRLAQLAQFSDEPESLRPESDYYFPPPPYYVLGVALQHVSLVERLVGAAQTVMMRSLTYNSYVRRYCVTDDTVVKRYVSSRKAFMIDEDGTSIDMVGMAAAADMTLYVCDRLGISAASQGDAPNLSDPNEYCTNMNNQAQLKWIQPSQSGESYEDAEYNLHASSYRQILGKYLRLDSDVPMDSGTKIDTNSETDSRTCSLWANDALGETYMLSCCSQSCQDLIRILLHEGANPMAVVAPVNSKNRKQRSFWARWLELLDELRNNYIESNGRSGGILLGDTYLNLMLTPKTIFDITKALIARGADINFPLKTGYGHLNYGSYFKREEPQDSYFCLVFSATAMFMLEECFNKEPEFREFAIAIESFLKTPARRIDGIRARTRSYPGCFSYDDPASLSPRECDMLWPMIEKWEKTGQATDSEALQSVLERICKVHNPDWYEDRERNLGKGSEEEGEEGEEGEEDGVEDGVEDEDEDDGASARSTSFEIIESS